MTELLTSTPRSVLRRTTLTWTALVCGVLSGALGFAAFLAVCIAPSVSYGGGRWAVSWTLVIGGTVVSATIGFLAGRAIPGRIAAPAIGGLLYLAAGILDYVNGSTWNRLLPIAHLPLFEGVEMLVSVQLRYACWLLALVAGLVLLAGSAVRRAGLVLGLGAVFAVSLISPTRNIGSDDPWVQRDPAAHRLVCTRSAPLVCTERVHAGLLPALTPVARGLLRHARTVLPVNRVVEQPADARGRAIENGTLPLDNLNGHSRLLRPGLSDGMTLARDYGTNLALLSCERASSDSFFPTATLLQDVAAALISGQLPEVVGDRARVLELRHQLLAEPGRARRWMDAYRAADARCDLPALTALTEPAP